MLIENVSLKPGEGLTPFAVGNARAIIGLAEVVAAIPGVDKAAARSLFQSLIGAVPEGLQGTPLAGDYQATLKMVEKKFS